MRHSTAAPVCWQRPLRCRRPRRARKRRHKREKFPGLKISPNLFACTIICVIFATLSGCAPKKLPHALLEEKNAPLQYGQSAMREDGVCKAREESGPFQRSPVPFERPAQTPPPRPSAPPKKARENPDKLPENAGMEKGRAKTQYNTRHSQPPNLKNVNAKFGYRAKAGYRKADSVQFIEKKAIREAGMEYRQNFNPRDMTTYQPYSRHHPAAVDRWPLDVRSPGQGNVYRILK